MKQILLYGAALLFIVFQSESCSKKSSTPTCKITGGSAGDASSSETFGITYNDAGKISTLTESTTSTSTTKVFTYAGDLVIVNTNSGGTVTTDSIVVNSDGLMVSDVNHSGTDVSLTTYTYSGTEVTSQTSQYDSQAPVTETFTFSNGDFDSGDGTTVTYNDKPSEPGDYIQFLQLVQYGAPFIKTAHQCTAIQQGSTVQNFNYTYDSSGKITQMVITTGTEVATYNYTYECD